MSDQFTVDRGDGPAAQEILDEVTNLYCRVHAAEQHEGSLYHRDQFLARTGVQVQRDGFAIVLARTASGELIGFAFGLTFPTGGWWSGNPTLPPADILDGPKFAVIELIVDETWRGQGLGHRLLDDLLSGRPEPYAMLTTRATNPARQMYARWGWQQVGTAQHTPTAPIMDQLVLPLP